MTRPSLTRTLAAALTLVALLGGVALGIGTSPQPTAAQPPDIVDVVVDYGDGRVDVRRATFSSGMTGLDLLEASELDLTASSGAVCAIGDTGCPAGDCFCACADTSDCRFWSYFVQAPDGRWTTAETGAAERELTPGAVDGWRWGGGTPPITATAATRATLLGADWLAGQQLANGSVGDHAGLTTELVLAARAAGVAPETLRAPGGQSAVAFLAQAGPAYAAESTAQHGKLVAGITAAGADPYAFAGTDYVTSLLAATPDLVAPGSTPSTWTLGWTLLGLDAAAALNATPPGVDLAQALTSSAAPDGGWGAAAGTAPTPDATGLAVQALIAAGTPVTATAVTDALGYLERTQNPDGGWAHGDGESNVNSTAYALQALIAAGEEPQSARWSTGLGADPLRYLLATQGSDGHLGPDTFPADLVATLQAVPALAGRTLIEHGRGVAARRAIQWMQDHRTDEGAFEGFNPGATIDAVLALAALGADPDTPAPSGPTATDYLAAQAADYVANGPSAAGKLLAGSAALGADPRAFGDVDLVAALMATYDLERGAFGDGGTWDNAWAIIGLRAAGEPAPDAAVTALIDAAATDGGWGFEAAADTATADSTGLALQALAAADVSGEHPAVRAGITVLHGLQNADGGFAGFGGDTSVSSTALASGGLIAYGQHVRGPGWMRGGDNGRMRRTPIEALLVRQSAAGGFAGFSGPNDPGATYAAALGLALRPLPVAVPATIHLPLAVHR